MGYLRLYSAFAHSHVCRRHLLTPSFFEVSNLNRQLLFRSQHVGMPKCEVACQVAAQMVPDPSAVHYIPTHGNVCDNTKFNVQYIGQFDLALNALDNVVARRRVNRLCLAAKVPLIEAGTTGYLGQVNVIDKDSNIACFECRTQETQKVYPICTIRSTPSMPVHTIVWSKEFYKLLFGSKVEESMLFEDPAGDEPSTYMQAVFDFREQFDAQASAETLSATTATVLAKLYVDEIQKQLDMDRYKTARKTPAPLDLETIQTGIASAQESKSPTQQPAYKSTDVWSQQDCVAELAACLAQADPATVLPSFDKDDDLAMRFVTAASNLRSYVFEIAPIQSLYSAKGIAGNIIPAIATTNAIAAGLEILQAFFVLRMQLEKKSKTGNLRDYCHYVNCLRGRTRNGLYLTASVLEAPNPKCFVCRNATIPLTINVNNWTLQDLLDKIIKKDLGFEEPTVMIDGDIIWEEGQDADREGFVINLAKKLSALPCGGIQHGTVFSVEDFSQDMMVDVAVTHQEEWEKTEDEGEADEHKFVVGGTKPTAAAVPPPSTDGDKAPLVGTEAKVETPDDDDSVVQVVDSPGEHGKRPSPETNDHGPAAKKARTGNGDAEDKVIEIE